MPCLLLEARLRHITLNTQNGGCYARMRVILIDVAICIARTSACVDTYINEEIMVAGQVPRQSWTPLHVLNHVWMEPPLQAEETGQARHQEWNGRYAP